MSFHLLPNRMDQVRNCKVCLTNARKSVHIHEPRSEFHEFHNGRNPRMILARVKSMGRLSEREITENVENRTVGSGGHVAGLILGLFAEIEELFE